MSNIANPLWNPWANDTQVLELYRRRCRQEVEEMTCAAQVAGILAPLVESGESLLDAGCGGGYYYWSFLHRNIPINYFGLDYTPEMIELARSEICSRAKISRERFLLNSIENLDKDFDNIICFNVLSNCPHYAQPLERLLRCARKRIVIRENMGSHLEVLYSPDPFLDEGKRHIRVYHNRYPVDEVVSLMEKEGFRVENILDNRTQGKEEMVCNIPHHWTILIGERVS